MTMNDADADRALKASGTQPFSELRPRARGLATGRGCLAVLGGPLMAFGLWLIAQAFLLPHEAEAARLSVITGACAALVGLWLLVTWMRRTFVGATKPAQVAIGDGHRLTPGATVPLRLHLSGPVRLASLTISVVCERRYMKEGTAAGSGSAASAQETETVWTEELLRQADVSLGPREHLTRVVALALPRIAKPSGPTLPSGDIAWYLDVARQSAGGTVEHDVFDLRVVRSESTVESIQPAASRVAPPAGSQGSILKLLGPGIGCALICLGFMLIGPIFLYLYFSGAPTRRGNPVMGLVAGILFSALGLLGAWALVTGRRQKRHNKRSRDPRRLP
jgi:hypothetical protein